MELREYQQECLQKMIEYEDKSALIVMATGLGKTVTFSEFLRYEVMQNDRMCMILSHRDELVHNPLRYLHDLPCGIELSKKHANGEKIISCSVQSLVNRLNLYNPYEVDVLVVDEAHHCVAPTYRKVLDYFHGAQIYGFTATSQRADGVGLGAVFDDLLFERNLLWGIENAYLCPIEGIQTPLKYRLESVKIVDGDYDQNQLAKAMSGTAVGIAEIYCKHARGQTIIFAPSVAEAREITKIINKQYGNIASTVTATTKNRDIILDQFENCRIKVLVNYAVLSEGVDLPCTESIIIARPTAKTNILGYSQMVGRGLRLYPGKKSCKVIDCVSISDVPLCTAATLIGKNIPAPKKQPTTKLPPPPEKDQNLIILQKDDIPSTFIKNEKEIKIMDKGILYNSHDVNWQRLTNGNMVVAIPSTTYIIDEPDSEGNVLLNRNSKYAKSRMDLQYIYDYVYVELTKNHSRYEHLWSKEKRKYIDNAKATQKQIDLILKLDPKFGDVSKLSCGDASIIIKELLYGNSAKGVG